MKHFKGGLAIEAHEAILGKDPGKIKTLGGVEVLERGHAGAKVTHVKIKTEEAGERLQKPPGNYITIETGEISNDYSFPSLCHAVADEFSRIISKYPLDSVLIIGLGNRSITPDSLGPKVIDNVIATRHLSRGNPNDFEGFTSVSAFPAGVLSETGIESSAVIEGIVKTVSPSLVIVIDALAARNLSRLLTTIQACDTGISPGSGVKNDRGEISEKTLGVPVLSIGIPTVSDAASLALDIFDQYVKDAFKNQEEAYKKIEEGLSRFEKNLFITPKDIDSAILKSARLVGYALNLALQKELSIDDISSLLS